MLDQPAPPARPADRSAERRGYAPHRHSLAGLRNSAAAIGTAPRAAIIRTARRRASSLLALTLILAALLPVGRAGAGPAAQLANIEATVNGDQELNVRAGPGLDAPIVGVLAPGARITLLAGPVQEDGWNWCQHSSGGWSVCEPLINLQGTSILVGAAAGPAPASAPVAAAPAAAPPAAPSSPASTSASASAPPRPAAPVQTAVSLPLPGGTPLIPTPTIRIAATATLVLPRPAGGNPTPALSTGVGAAPTPLTGLPQPPPGLVPGAPPGGGASTVGGAATPTALIRIASPVPQPGQVAPGQVAPGQVAPGQVVPGQVAPGQVPSAPGQVPPVTGIFTPTPGPGFLPR